MADYPDGTMPVSITGQTISELNVDIIAQTIGNLAVDIAAQSLAQVGVNIKAQDLAKVAIDIAAQTLSELAIKTTGVTKLAIDIAAQTVGNLGINIAAQDLAQLVINVAAQTVGVYIGAEWEVKQGNEKFLLVTASNQASAASAYTSYTVPSGKTYYINNLGFYIRAYIEGNRNLNQMGFTNINNQTDSLTIGVIGGNGGGGISFQSPLKIPENKEVRLYVTNWANHTVTMGAHCGGYVI